MKLVFVATVFDLFSSLSVFLEGVFDENVVQINEVIPFCIAMAINIGSWAYPALALSADFLTFVRSLTVARDDEDALA